MIPLSIYLYGYVGLNSAERNYYMVVLKLYIYITPAHIAVHWKQRQGAVSEQMLTGNESTHLSQQTANSKQSREGRQSNTAL